MKTNLSSHLKGCVIYVLSMQSTFFGYPENTLTFIACGSTYTQSITSQKVGKFNERLFMGFLKEDLFYFFSKIIFQNFFFFFFFKI